MASPPLRAERAVAGNLWPQAGACIYAAANGRPEPLERKDSAAATCATTFCVWALAVCNLQDELAVTGG